MNSRSSFVCAAARIGTFAMLAWIFLCGDAVAQRDKPGIVRGVVWNTENAPIPNGKVRLRNVETGRIFSTATTSSAGQFVFDDVPRNFYIVELVSDRDRTLAVGPTLRVEPGATVSTVVRLPSQKSSSAGMFSNAALAVLSAASGVGVMAVNPNARPISPQ